MLSGLYLKFKNPSNQKLSKNPKPAQSEREIRPIETENPEARFAAAYVRGDSLIDSGILSAILLFLKRDAKPVKVI